MLSLECCVEKAEAVCRDCFLSFHAAREGLVAACVFADLALDAGGEGNIGLSLSWVLIRLALGFPEVKALSLDSVQDFLPLWALGICPLI